MRKPESFCLDVDEIFDKSAVSNVPIFFVIYGMLYKYGHLVGENEEDVEEWDKTLGIKNGIFLTINLIASKKSRKRNVRIIRMLTETLDLSVWFWGKDRVLLEKLELDEDPLKYEKYINHEEPYDD